MVLYRGIRDHVVESTDSSMVKRDDGCSVEETLTFIVWSYFGRTLRGNTLINTSSWGARASAVPISRDGELR